MKRKNKNHSQIDLDNLQAALQKELDLTAKEELKNIEIDLVPADLMRLKSLENKIEKNLYDIIKQSLEKLDTFVEQKTKEIILNLEPVPFQFGTRANPVKEFGRPWRHDGGPVTFKLRMPHEKLEVYSTRGEFLCEYPVQNADEVHIDDLKPGVYILYLPGRKITEME
jgi:hypothetical protein